MASPYSEHAQSLSQAEHIGPTKTGDNIQAKRAAMYYWDGSNWQRFAATVTITHGKTIKTVTGTVSANTDIIAAVASKRIKVIAYSLITSSATANTITFQSNASTALWTIPLQALSGTVAGANLATVAPSFLFATTAGEKLTLNVSTANSVTYSVAYFDDDAS